MLKNLHKCIDDIVSEVSKEIKNINDGGCGWFVYYVSRELKKQGVDCEIINYNYKSELKPNLEFAKQNKKIQLNKLGFHHLLIRVGNHVCDGTQIYRKPPKYWLYQGVSYYTNMFKLDDLEKYLTLNVWCTIYDSSQNKKLLEIIRKHVEIYGQKENNCKKD